MRVTVEERDQAQRFVVQAGASFDGTPELIAALGDARITRVATREPTLEDAYVALVEGASG